MNEKGSFRVWNSSSGTKQVGLKNVALCLLLKGCDQAASNSFQEIFAAADPDVRNHLGRSGIPLIKICLKFSAQHT
jgi:hypothetical protein